MDDDDDEENYFSDEEQLSRFRLMKEKRKLNNKDPYDDEEGHYKIILDSEFANRYHIKKVLGQGTYGKVVAAFDKVTRRHCAIKIIRAVQKYRDASKIELRVLSTLTKYDRSNLNQCIQLRHCFDYRNHICIVTDLLGISL